MSTFVELYLNNNSLYVMNLALVCYRNAIYITDNAMYTFVYVTIKLKKK